VFTIPKRLRLYFRYDRSLLGALCQAAWRGVRTVYQATSGRPDSVPGRVGAIQTFGDLIHWHPHIHALVSEGVFLPDGTFLPLPELASEPFLKLWEQEVFALLLGEGRINDEVVANIRSWKHSGFSVDQSVRLEAGDRAGIQRLIQYFWRCPFSQARMIRLRSGRATAGQVEVTEAGKVLYKTGDLAAPRLRQGRQSAGAIPRGGLRRFAPRAQAQLPDLRAIGLSGRLSAVARRAKAEGDPAHPGCGRTSDPLLRLVLEQEPGTKSQTATASLHRNRGRGWPAHRPRASCRLRASAGMKEVEGGQKRGLASGFEKHCGQLESLLCRGGVRIRVSSTLLGGLRGRIPALGGLRGPPKEGILTPSHLKG